MGKKKKENPLDYINLPSLDMNPEIKKNVWALFILAISIISALGLVDNGGMIGEYLKKGLTWALGWGRWLLPSLFLVWSVFIFFKEKLEIKALHYIGLALFFISTISLLQLSIISDQWQYALINGSGGGHLGYWLGLVMVKAIGLVAACIISVFIGLIALMFIFNTTLFHIFHKTSQPFRYVLRPVKSAFSWFGKKDAKEDDDNEEENEEEENNDDEGDEEENEEEEKDDDNEEENEDEENNDDEGDEEENEEEVKFEQKSLPMAKPIIDEAVNIWYPTKISINLPIDLLENRQGKPKSGDIKECGRLIQSTLSNFGIQVEMDEVSVGPTVTQYSLRPADGVKLSKITNLQNNLSMALAAHPLRIEAPIPGKPLVGIEVPNKTIATVGLREIITSEQFKSKGNKLTFALGKDVTNKAWVTTVDSMPHLMVAGQTMSGKSVMINSIIISLLYHNNPDDLRMIMVDTKRIELTQYKDIPHLLTPVITDAPKTINALRWTINEMDRRLRLLEKYNKKDIGSFNQSAKQKLPYIVFIIDELADLMMLSGKEVEPPIVRIAQLARAVGIHLVLATQRPSVDVITGLIKANLPARIAFAVASSIDSRTILDGPGAEKLLGRGDMLFTNASMAKPKRIQGAFVSEKEIQKIVAEIKKQAGRPNYMEGITEKQKVSGNFSMGMSSGSNSNDDEDDKLEAAREVIVNSGKASATMLQRHLGVGYARAAKLLDILEEQGVIGPSQGSKPREVLITKEQLQSGMAMSGMPLHNPAEFVAPDEFLNETEDEEEEELDEDEEDQSDDEEDGDDGNDDEEENEEENDEDNDEEDDEGEEEEEEEESDDEEENAEEEEEEEEEEPPFAKASAGREEDAFITKASAVREEEKDRKQAVVNKEQKRKNSFADMKEDEEEEEQEEEQEEEEDPSVVEVRISSNKIAPKKPTKVERVDDDFDRFFSR